MPFLHEGLHLVMGSGHLVARAAIDERHRAGAEPARRPAQSTAVLPPPITATLFPTAAVRRSADVPKEREAVDDAVDFFALHTEGCPAGAPVPMKDGVVITPYGV